MSKIYQNLFQVNIPQIDTPQIAIQNNNKISNIWNNFFSQINTSIAINGFGGNSNFGQNAILEDLKEVYKDCTFETIKNNGIDKLVIKVYDKKGQYCAEVVVDKDNQLQIYENYDKKTKKFNSIKIINNNAKTLYVKNNGIWNQIELNHLYSADTTEESINHSNSNKYSVSQIVDDLYKDIYAKTGLGLSTTGKNIKEHVKRIDKYNVMKVMKSYYNKTGKDKQSLVSAIMHEVGLSPADRAEMILHIENCLLDKYESMGVYVKDLRALIKNEINYQKDKIGVMSGDLLDKLNKKLADRLEGKLLGQDGIKKADGEINEVSYQGRTGDCWLLAAINSITKSPKGKAILDNSVKVNKGGSVTVHLKGVNKTYTFSQEELYGSTELSTGDMDVRALEKAVERYMLQEKHDDINGDRPIIAYKILLGESHVDLGGWDQIWDRTVGISDSYKKKIQDPNTICCASVHDAFGKSSDSDVAYTLPNGQKIYKNHSYSVVRAGDKYVYLINPWDGGTEIPMTFEEFKNIFNCFTDVTL